VAIWQIFTLKKHVVDKARLKPTRIPLPHSLNTSRSLSICLITVDPQREVKDVVAHSSFPAELRSQITRVIGYSKLKARYKSFESRRQLRSDHDIFMADDRIESRLPETLGKTFYKGNKKPMTVRIASPQKNDGQRVKKDKRKNPDQHWKLKAPNSFAEEIQKALTSTALFLAPSATTAIKVGKSSFTAEQLADNIKSVTSAMTDWTIVKGWRNIKGIHIKGANTMAMPIWLADELWAADEDVLENGAEVEVVVKGAGKKRKRKAEAAAGAQGFLKKSKDQAADDEVAEAASRKAKLLKQKSEAIDGKDEFAGLMQGVKAAGDGTGKVKAKRRTKVE
jgi:ribosome biogenesis protein UTP30